MNSVFFISLMNGGAWGGSEELWFQTALYAAQQGYKVGCAFYDWPQKAERIDRLKKAGCAVYLFSNKGREKRTLIERLQYKVTKRRVKRYARSLPLLQYDMAVINLGYLEIVSHYWKDFQRYAKNYTLLFHVHDENGSIKQKRKTILKNWVAEAKHNLFASERTQKFLEAQLSMEVPNAATLFNPITFKAPGHPPPYPPLSNGRYLFIMLATLDVRRKAQDNVIKALSSEKWKQRNWQLYLYGGGESEKKLERLLLETKLSEKIILKGHTGDVKEALAEAHLLLQITHIDAMPLAVVEALAMAKPLAVSDVGDMPKWVTEGVNGWISPSASVAAIEETLEKAWQSRDRWEAMGNVSFQLFQEKFPATPEAFFLKQLNS